MYCNEILLYPYHLILATLRCFYKATNFLWTYIRESIASSKTLPVFCEGASRSLLDSPHFKINVTLPLSVYYPSMWRHTLRHQTSSKPSSGHICIIYRSIHGTSEPKRTTLSYSLPLMGWNITIVSVPQTHQASWQQYGITIVLNEEGICFPYHWLFMEGIHRSTMGSTHQRSVMRNNDVSLSSSCWTSSPMSDAYNHLNAHITPLQCLK